jgi:hypothetical protein
MGEVAGEQGLKFHAEAGALLPLVSINCSPSATWPSMLRLLSAHSPVRQHFHDMDSLTLRFMRFLLAKVCWSKACGEDKQAIEQAKGATDATPNPHQRPIRVGRSGVSSTRLPPHVAD